MSILNIDNAVTGEYGTPNLSIPSDETDGPGTALIEWQNNDWGEQWGAFTMVPEYQNVLLMKGIWHTGKGWTADGTTTARLQSIRGWGKDTWDDIIFNQDVMSMAAGDSFAHAIYDPEDEGRLINLKPLNPGLIKTVVKPDGMIKEYRQMSKITEGQVLKTFKLPDMFVLSFNRMADHDGVC